MDLLDQAETLTRASTRGGADSDDDIFGFGQRAVSGAFLSTSVLPAQRAIQQLPPPIGS